MLKYIAPSSWLSAIDSGRARMPPSAVRVTSIAVSNRYSSVLSRLRFSSSDRLTVTPDNLSTREPPAQRSSSSTGALAVASTRGGSAGARRAAQARLIETSGPSG